MTRGNARGSQNHGGGHRGNRGHHGGSRSNQERGKGRGNIPPTQPRLGPEHETRPLLRPIVFVRSTATPFLFQFGEELLKPVVDDVETEENTVLTPDRVAQVFNGVTIRDTDSDNKELEEIDFTEKQKSLEIIAKGDARNTTLTKTNRGGLEIDEKTVGQVVGRGKFVFVSNACNESENGKEKGKPGGGGRPRQKEGDEVGKAALKIGSSNVGFKMLEGMGWSEGGIGVTGGLEQPLAAIIKRSKLGLGATKAQ